MTIHEQKGNLHVWWFPTQFSQSHFGEYRESGTNSCTLIALILADKICKVEQGLFRNFTDFSQRSFDLFGTAINEGNAVYNRSMGASATSFINTTSAASTKRTRGSQNLSIPDALNVLHSQGDLNFKVQEWFYTHVLADPSKPTYSRSVAMRLSQIFTIACDLFHPARVRKSAALYLAAALIADSRTVIFIFQFPANIIGFFDSHNHGKKAGAVMAMCPFVSAQELVLWFVDMLHKVYSSKPALYEVSFLSNDCESLPYPNH